MFHRRFFSLTVIFFSLGLGGCSEDNTAGTSGLGREAGALNEVDLGPPPGWPIPVLVDLRADNNRNGAIDLNDASENNSEETWEATHGAIFLANIDDDQKRCPTTGSDASLPTCFDAADEVVNSSDDLLDMAPLKIVPWPAAPEGTTGKLSVSSPANTHIRIFKKVNDTYVVFKPETTTLTLAELQSGVDFYLEGKDIVRNAKEWDGFVDVTFTVEYPGAVAQSDTVRLRQAPLVTFHHLNQPKTVYATDFDNTADTQDMLTDLTAGIMASGISQPLVKLNIDDQWTQDLFETAYMSMPAASGQQHVIEVFIRSANVEAPRSTTNPLRSAGKVIYTFRGKDVAAIQEYDLNHNPEMDSLDSFGNTETIPPYSLNGVNYPLGRLFRGSVADFYPDANMSLMFESQKIQPPVYIDTSWLLVGHVDETISFVKSSSARGWAMVVNDARLAKTMLEQAVKDGNGGVKMFKGLMWADYDTNSEYSAEVSISQVLADTAVMGESAKAAVEVDNQVAILKKETGITDAEILHLPFLHWKVGGGSLAYQVGTVNGISLGDKHYGAADPHGPVINGQDIFKKQMEDEYAKVGITVHWIEDWNLYHRYCGEVHCGSNMLRQPTANVRWWEGGR